MNTNQIDKLARAAAARIILKATKGRFAKVVYTNTAGETKTYTVRTGVKKHLTSFDPNYRPLGTEGPVKVYSLTAGNEGYKSFLPERILGIRCGNLRYGSFVA